MTLIISSLFLGKAAAQHTIPVQINPQRDIQTGFFTNNDLFQPPSFGGPGETRVEVPDGGFFTLNYTFNTGIILEDIGGGGTESIHITLENGTGSSGTTNEHILDKGATVDYKFTLTGATGDGPSGVIDPRNPSIDFPGVLPTGTGETGPLVLEETNKSITTDTMVFSDLHLRLEPHGGRLVFNTITLGVDADRISAAVNAPEPAGYIMLALAVLALVRFVSAKQKKEIMADFRRLEIGSR